MHLKPGWTSFFALDIEVPEDFLAQRDDSPPQQRERFLDAVEP